MFKQQVNLMICSFDNGFKQLRKTNFMQKYKFKVFNAKDNILYTVLIGCNFHTYPSPTPHPKENKVLWCILFSSCLSFPLSVNSLRFLLNNIYSCSPVWIKVATLYSHNRHYMLAGKMDVEESVLQELCYPVILTVWCSQYV